MSHPAGSLENPRDDGRSRELPNRTDRHRDHRCQSPVRRGAAAGRSPSDRSRANIRPARLGRHHLPGVDLLLLDLGLAAGDGVSLVQRVRDHAAQSAIIVFSGSIASADEVRGLAALGVTDYVNEHLDAQQILPSLAQHLFPRQLQRAAALESCSRSRVLPVRQHHRRRTDVEHWQGRAGYPHDEPTGGLYQGAPALPASRLGPPDRRRLTGSVERPTGGLGTAVRAGGCRRPDRRRRLCRPTSSG